MPLVLLDKLLDTWSSMPWPAALWYPSVRPVAQDERQMAVEEYWKDALAAIRAVKPITTSDEPLSASASNENLPSDADRRLDRFVEEARTAYPAACNQSTLYVARRMKAGDKGLETTANHQAAFLMSSVWKRITPTDAQGEADRGRLVIAALPMKYPSKPGHTAIVLPQIGGRKVVPSGNMPDLYCPIVGGGAQNSFARDHHGFGANYVFGSTPSPDKGFTMAPAYYVRYFLAP